ncbi:hypothetical protein V144x_08270 [Gimesia aquarii]|uniref:Uncharacterized protein n=1 Tax=Gimesia aquarii TaxID=2527964 RepID=A0A517VQT7_9PLAN|nr:hypothetical protein V144x_08270 [Gimesia aquarii]
MERVLANQIATCEVGNRPGRIEPRVIKRRKRYQEQNELLTAILGIVNLPCGFRVVREV